MFFNRKNIQDNLGNNKLYLTSATDLRLLPQQIIYVEGVYNNRINKIIRSKYDEISSKFKFATLSTEFVYLPVIAEQLQGSFSLSYILKYYFPNVDEEKQSQITPAVFQTEFISRLLFSIFAYDNQIKPGLFHYVKKDTENLFVYEYFPFESSNKSSILRQIDYYANSISESNYRVLPSVDEENISCLSCEDLFEEKVLESCYQPEGKKEDDRYSRREHEIISNIKSAIRDLKEMGFYELLIKEIGSVLFEKDTNKMFQPSRIFMDDEFKIFLTDFNDMEIAMTPLPKSLFILFLRHPEGINLKSLIDYNKELLEIYKLLSYRETYFDMVESINRICNPFEGSINEKLSRIKEAFLRKISMDTAKYYIVAGERGMKKRIEIDRSLIQLPKVFEEIERTKVPE
jgi:hypothetical protein